MRSDGNAATTMRTHWRNKTITNVRQSTLWALAAQNGLISHERVRAQRLAITRRN